MVSVEIHNGKFWTNDLFVYYSATKDYFSGNNPYVQNYGLDTGYFKYAPTTLYFFYPTIWLNYFTVQIIHTVLLTISLVSSISILHFLFIYKKGEKKRYWLLYLGFLLIVNHVVRGFHMGNVNLILMFFFCVGLFSLKKGRAYQSAIFWSLMIILKPIVILAFIPLLFFKQVKVIIYMAIGGLFYFLLPIIFSGIDGLLSIWSNWLGAISAHGEYIVSENSLRYLLEYYTGIKSNWGASFFFLGCLFIYMFWTIKKGIKIGVDEWLVVFLAFCPNFFVTDTQHFLLSLPLLFVLIKNFIEANHWTYWGLFVCAVLFFSFNMNDLIGRNMSDSLDAMGTLGIANLVFILLLFIVKNSNQKKCYAAESKETHI